MEPEWFSGTLTALYQDYLYIFGYIQRPASACDVSSLAFTGVRSSNYG